MTPAEDPRPLYFAGIAQNGRLVAAVRPDQLDSPTPCPEYDVRALIAHLLGGLRRVTHVATGGDAFDVPRLVTGVADGEWSAEYEAAEAALLEVWRDDAVLDRPMTLPFGTMPGRGAAAAFVVEVATHGWDLAAATGQEGALHPEIGSAALQLARQFIPAEPRGGPVPFGPVVEVPADGSPYAQLAGWLGRTPDFAEARKPADVVD